MLYEEKIKEILGKRGISSQDDITRFLNPSFSHLHNPFLLSGMEDACQRIKQAIVEKQTVLIYGDYDTDGICSVSMLYLYLQKMGLDPIAFIPNRHTDGYGLSEDTVDLIANTYFPDLVITVDTGISARNEIEMLMDCGIDVIVTDHHEPPESLPECIIIDPKCYTDKYPFSGLSGAGVVFKLITALGGIDVAEEYIDICAVSTIGDIVPLQDENRVITTFGLKKINKKDCRMCFAFLKKYLKMDSFTSTDIAFKLVPRLNASGRIDSAYKGFEFLTSTIKEVVESKFAEIEADNTERLRQSQEIQESVDLQIRQIDFNKEAVIFLRNDNINLGLIGIIASKLCFQYLRPVFIFSSDGNGNLKASIRSIEGVNVFNILDKHRDILVDVGGHSLAGGLTIKEENYNKFKSVIMAEFAQIKDNLGKAPKAPDYDIEVEEKDLNLELAKAIEQLEPFGFENAKPVLLVKSKKCNYQEMKSCRHFKIITQTKKEVISFFGYKYVPCFARGNEVQIFLNLEVDPFFKGKRQKSILKDLFVEPVQINADKNLRQVKALLGLYQSAILNQENYVNYIDDLDECSSKLALGFGTLVVTDDFSKAQEISKKYNLDVVNSHYPTGQSCVLYDPIQILDMKNLIQYQNIIFADGYYSKSQFDNVYANCYVVNNQISFNIDTDRQVFANCYKSLLPLLPVHSNDIIELCSSIAKQLKDFSISQIAFTLLVCAELGFVNMKDAEIVEVERVQNPAKRELTSSKIYTRVKEVL